MRIEIERADVPGEPTRRRLFVSLLPSPVYAPAERSLEMLNRVSNHCIDHLLMEAGIGFRWIEAASKKNLFVVQIDWLIPDLVCTVVIDDRYGVRCIVRYRRTRIESLVAHA